MESRMIRAEYCAGLGLVQHGRSCEKPEEVEDQDEECYSYTGITFVQVWLFSCCGDLELVAIRHVFRRRNGISSKCQSRTKVWGE